jgi:hypothetical protein
MISLALEKLMRIWKSCDRKRTRCFFVCAQMKGAFPLCRRDIFNRDAASRDDAFGGTNSAGVAENRRHTLLRVCLSDFDDCMIGSGFEQLLLQPNRIDTASSSNTGDRHVDHRDDVRAACAEFNDSERAGQTYINTEDFHGHAHTGS